MSDDEKKPAELAKPEPKKSFAKLLTCEILDRDGLIYKPHCKLCNTPHRKQAEEIFEAENSYLAVKDFLDQNDVHMHASSIRTHIVEHYKTAGRMLSLVDYCENLENMVKQRRSRREDLEMLANMCRLEAARISSLQTNQSFSQEKERNQMLMACIKGMRDCLDSLNKMEDSEAKATAMQNKFLEIWKDMITNASDEAERKVLVDALNKFKQVLEQAPELK